MMCGMLRRLGPLCLAVAMTLWSAPAGADESEPTVISQISDSRINESSGLAISSAHGDLGYTMNDAGNAPIVYAIKISTGKVVGTTRVGGGDVRDAESIAIDREGTMWLADLGDNKEKRDDVALYAFPEPGAGDRTVTARRYPVTYENGPVDVEALMVNPITGAKFLASKKKKDNGTLFALPAKLSTSRANLAADLGRPVPPKVSDGTFTTNGSHVLLRTRDAVHVFDPESWDEVKILSVPPVKQGESIAMEPSGASFVIGSEGKDSPLIRVPYESAGSETTTPSPTPGGDRSAPASEKESSGVPGWLAIAAGLIAFGAVATAAWVVARKR